MIKAIYLVFFVSLGIFAADSDNQKDLTNLSHNLKAVGSCFKSNIFDREKFNNLLETDEIFKEEFQNESMQPVLEKVNSGARIIQIHFHDALIDSWFEKQAVSLMLMGELPEDGHDICSDFLSFASELAGVLKLKDKRIFSPTDNEWFKFMLDNSNKDWVKARKACPLLEKGGSYVFAYDILIEYFINRRMFEEAQESGFCLEEDV